MSASQPDVASVVPIVDNGSFVERFGIVVLAEGFVAGELDIFRAAVDDLVDCLHQTEPFASNWSCLSLTRIEAVSRSSGLVQDGRSQGNVFATRAGRAPRTLELDWDRVESLTSLHAPEWDGALVLANDASERGCTYQRVAVTTLQADWLTVAIHELGHAGFALGDEYVYEGGGHRYPGLEPGERNLTRLIDPGRLKWAHLVAATTPIPTQANPDCTRPNFRPSTVPAGTVGTFEGARGYCCGIHRPEYDCLMRTLACDRFCAVCADTISLRLSRYAP